MIDGYEKEMPVRSDKRRKSTSYYVATGWKEFQQSNDISQGDKCVFKFITSEDKICLAKITKRKTPARPLPPAAKAPATEYLPANFVRLAGIDTKENIIMISLDGNECQLGVRKDTRKLSTQYYLSIGWRAFMRYNNIPQGCKCVFKYITSADKMCLAKIIKAQAKKVDVDVDDEDPSFVVTITTTNKTMLRFLSDFVTLAGIDKKKTIVFKNLSGYEKEMAVQRVNQFRSSSYSVASGWKEFLRDTDLSEGDICVFKFIRSEDKICLAKITKKKTPARPLPPAIEPPVTEVECVDDGDDGDPFFVATIIHKSRLYMPVDFVRSAGIDTKKTLTILGLDGYEKEMLVRYDKKGWPAFRRSNNISEGDECEFKYIRSEDTMCLVKVTKRKTQARSLPPAAVDTETKRMPVDFVLSAGIDTKKAITFKSLDGYEKEISRLPKDFVALAKIDTKENIIIKSLDGNERQMVIQSYQCRVIRYHFSIGWPAFMRSNNISEGDECEFKYIRSEDKMCLVKVTKRKTQARSLPPAAVDTETKLMPVDFVRSVGIDTKKTITLKSLDGYEKEIFVRVETKYHYQAKRYFLGKGWMDFARNTNISVGDKCVFKFITNEDKLCLAKITKARPTQVDDDDMEVDNVMDDKDVHKDVELVDGVDDGDPFFQTRLSSPAKVVKRKRGQPHKVVKRKSGRPAKVVKRKRGRPAKIMMAENVKITAAEVVKGKRGVDTCVEAS
ncbi:DNA-binding pseudobarrel domain-containing protein [Artemisia annua]|uniref:DNA-binding pseudobarrel domain-containing protein n=1 Tax=Artemisia annua TaxID=35608 RepID=A0A2U1PG53_ARTAN|nr:DNA-binding pseudobarrel domain-containing protein [Artemisia annua]